MAKLRIGYLVAPVVFALDQLVKWIVTGPLGVNEIGDQFYLLPFFQFTYTQNIGISLGLLNATTETGRWMLVALTTAIALGVAFWISREKNRTDQVALGMVLAARSATSSTERSMAMSSTSPTCILVRTGRF